MQEKSGAYRVQPCSDMPRVYLFCVYSERHLLLLLSQRVHKERAAQEDLHQEGGGGGQADEEQLAGPAADDEAQYQPDAYCASTGSANRIRGQKIPPWVKLRVSFIKYPLNVKKRTRPERPPHLIRHCKRDHSPPMNKSHCSINERNVNIYPLGLTKGLCGGMIKVSFTT